MKYLCMIFSDSTNPIVLSDKDEADLVAEHLAYDREVESDGRLVIARALQPGEASTTVRVRGGEVSITDGPYVETKEQFTGFYLIEVRDLNEAIQVAAKIPSARFGAVEVRPIRELVAP